MRSRERILEAVRKNEPRGSFLQPEIPQFASEVTAMAGTFARAANLMGAVVVDVPADVKLASLIRDRFPDARRIVSAAAELLEFEQLDLAESQAGLASIDVGIVRAAFGVAETGSIFVDETEMQVRSFPHLCEHLVALVEGNSIVANLHSVYGRPELHRSGYGVLMSGPSATADIEGVLVRGAQGVRSLTLLRLLSHSERLS